MVDAGVGGGVGAADVCVCVDSAGQCGEHGLLSMLGACMHGGANAGRQLEGSYFSSACLSKIFVWVSSLSALPGRPLISVNYTVQSTSTAGVALSRLLVLHFPRD